jgi:hypothetical protein
MCCLNFLFDKNSTSLILPGYESEAYPKIKKGKEELKCQKCNEKVKNCNKF